MASPFRQPVPVSVEYTSRGKRVIKRFDDAYAARRFFIAKDYAGKNPTVRKAEHNVLPQQSLPEETSSL